MEQTIIFSSPVQSDYDIDNNMAVADECEFDIAKAAAASATSSSRSPTCVIFAVDERLDGVFRVSDHRDNDDGEPRRPLEEDQQGELSTFSDDTDESSSSSSSSSGDDGNDHHRRYRYLPTRRRRTAPLMSIFRPTGGTKRRCDFEEEDRRYRSDDDDDDHEDDDDGRGSPTKPPSLRHANPVGSREYGHDAHDAEVSLSSTFSYASAFKRICRSISSSSYSSLVVAEEEVASAFPLATTISDGSRSADDVTAVSTMTIFEHLQHPLSSSTTTIFENIEFRYPKEDNEGI
ncbi:hypothetical protein ACHAW5_007391 [Stephanodiscus triporus]|uniref:Uncharacterized protein n=1 Tax=Stephanodiscus triporus TaxID=2934178 RepID=A0ABD3QEJ4_9STRA